MRLRPSSLVTTGLLAVSVAPAGAQLTGSAAPLDDLSQAGALFLLVPVGGRATALGQAAVADGGASESAFWNPAGLAYLPTSEVAVHHATTFASDNTAIAGYLTTNRIGVLGAAAYLVDYGSQAATGTGDPTGTFSTKNIELLASYATTLTTDFAFGLNYKLIQFRQECSGDCGPLFTETIGTTHAVDVGAQYSVGSRDALRIGVALQHAGFKLQLKNRDQADPLPTRVQVGVSYRVQLPRPAGAPAALDARFLLDLQDAWGGYVTPDARVGVEVGAGDLVRIRTGYAFLDSESGGPSVGLGVRVGRVAVDFAQVFFDSSNLDQPVHFSLRAQF
jgi:hypothetical protein